MNGPTILLFRPKTDLREWIANPGSHPKRNQRVSIRKIPPYTKLIGCWIIVNFVSSTSTVAYTYPIFYGCESGIARPAVPTWQCVGKYGKRKRFRWKDFNNTAEDFEKIPFLKTVSLYEDHYHSMISLSVYTPHGHGKPTRESMGFIH